jgi:DNA-binding SARP family transcriptional activator
VLTLGRTAAQTTGTSLDGDWLDTRVGSLFRYLIVRRSSAVTADEIGESLWRDADYTITRTVRTCVRRLRLELEPHRPNYQVPDYVLTRGGSYLLNREQVDIDADDFERHVSLGLAEPDRQLASAQLERGLALYKGEFLADAPFAEWALSERRRLHDLACEGLRSLADIQLRSKRFDAARSTLGRLSGLQPLDERVVRELIEVEIRTGRGSDAKRRYDHLTRMMRDTLGTSPSFTLASLAR